ncbi:hypothetical protein HPB49_008339 [Dermacentor silvarum]|uniref:Uncharacterized protein n=1 Tax=Dermacentor silvarum TaxID=543639 RepID=A0ACB8C2Q7_DERSI|nr:hypothetical protein HPB49_008339 [Dermacentor silvarum]
MKPSTAPYFPGTYAKILDINLTIHLPTGARKCCCNRSRLAFGVPVITRTRPGVRCGRRRQTRLRRNANFRRAIDPYWTTFGTGRSPAKPNDGYLRSDHVLGRRGTRGGLGGLPRARRASERRERPTLLRIPSHGHLGRGYRCEFCSQEAARSARPNRREEESRRTTDRIATRRPRRLIDDDRDCDPPNSCAGWTVVVSRREKKRQEAGNPSQRDTQTAGKPSKSLSASNAKLKEERRSEQKAQYVAKVNANTAKSARMPTFAKKDEHRVVVRPRGGLVVSATKMSVLRAAIITAANIKIEEAEDDSFAPNAAQNIIVLSTPSEARSFRYGSIRSITVEERTYETFAYKSTPDNTSRGVISGVGREEPEEQITRFLVNKHNPTVMAAHRLGNTESVVILFEGNKVPHYVKYGGFVTKCTLYRQHREMAPAPAKESGKVTLSRRFDFPELRASGTRHEQNGVASRDRSRAEPEDAPWADVTSGRPKEARPPRPEPQVQAHPSPTNKSDVNRAAMTQKSGAPSGAAAATPKEPGKMPSGSSCSEQCKKVTRELKATVQKMEKAMEELQTAMAAMQLTIKQQRGVIDQQRDAIRRLQEGEARDEANDNKLTTDADEKDNGTLANIAGNAFANTTTPETFQFTAKATIPTRASIVAAARGLEEQPEEEIESASESDEEEGDSASVTSVAAINNGDKTKPLGYGSLSKKIAQPRAEDYSIGWDYYLPETAREQDRTGEPEEQVPLSDEAARKIIVYPLPKSTNPERDAGRRAARAAALVRQHQRDEGAVYVDAARHPRRRNAFAAVLFSATTGKLLTACTVRARTAGQAEEAAIALATGWPGTRTVLSDSKQAIKNFARGVVWRGTERLVRSIVASRAACGAAAGPTIALKWFPAHMGRQLAPDIENRNEEADAVARDLITCRTAAARPPETSGEEREEDLDPLTDYGGILAAYREARRAFPPPHNELSRAEAVQLRQLQTECVLTPALARHVCPDMFVDAKCSVCERELATLRHIMWGECNSAVHNGNGQCQDATYPKEVGAWIRSEDSTTQRRAIQRLEEALAKQKRKRADAPDDGSGRSPSIQCLAGAQRPQDLGPGTIGLY